MSICAQTAIMREGLPLFETDLWVYVTMRGRRTMVPHSAIFLSNLTAGDSLVKRIQDLCVEGGFLAR